MIPHRLAWFRSLILTFALAVILVPGVALAQDEFEEVPLPDTPPARQFAWVMQVINGQPLGDLREHFSDRFLEIYTVKRLEQLLLGMRGRLWEGGAARVVAIPQSSDLSIGVTIVGDGSRRVMSALLVLDDTDAKIAGLTFSPAIGSDRGSADWDTMSGELGSLHGGSTFGCYEIVADTTGDAGALRLRPIHEFAQNRPVNTGAGTLALSLLRVVAEQAADARVSWSQEIPIREAQRSVPPGSLAGAKEGSLMTVGELAQRMMRDADNTAMDHLIAHIGKSRVADALERHGATRPFLTTRQYFALKLGGDSILLDRYAASPADARQDILDAEVTIMTPDVMQAGAWTTPRAVDRIGWFASARDLCHDWMVLRRIEAGEGMQALSAAMRAARGIPLSREVWPDTCFRGGAEPGAQSLTMLLKRRDGRWFTIAAAWNDPEKPLEQARLVDLLKSGVGVLEAFEPAPPAPVPSAPAPGTDPPPNPADAP